MHWPSFALGAITLFFVLLASSFIPRRRSVTSSVTVYDESGRPTVHTADRKQERTADRVNRSGENSIEPLVENVHAVVRRQA